MDNDDKAVMLELLENQRIIQEEQIKEDSHIIDGILEKLNEHPQFESSEKNYNNVSFGKGYCVILCRQFGAIVMNGLIYDLVNEDDYWHLLDGKSVFSYGWFADRLKVYSLIVENINEIR